MVQNLGGGGVWLSYLEKEPENEIAFNFVTKARIELGPSFASVSEPLDTKKHRCHFRGGLIGGELERTQDFSFNA